MGDEAELVQCPFNEKKKKKKLISGVRLEYGTLNFLDSSINFSSGHC